MTIFFWFHKIWMQRESISWFIIALLTIFTQPYLLRESAAQSLPKIQLAEDFIHPGILHTQEDLDRMREKVQSKAHPWQNGFRLLERHPHSQTIWDVRGGHAVVVREAGKNQHNTDLWQDSNAAYQNALMWAITQKPSHAQKAVMILNAWSSKLKRIEGHDKHLAAGLYGFKLANAAEILRYTYPQWREEEIQHAQSMFLDVFYPVIKDFATFANGNWDAACMKMMLAIGVFCNRPDIFNRAVEYYYQGAGNGRITHYVINETGQCQESGRDQQHTQLGLGLLAEACEVAWSQGMDLYGAVENRLLKGFEYTAKYNLGHEVPFVPHTDTTGKYVHQKISEKGRGRLRDIYEMPYAHYGIRQGLKCPFTKMAAETIRPEGAAFQADHPGFGTLLFYREG